jgi:phosphodiesterase/alkaline phosphatase D-like protein
MSSLILGPVVGGLSHKRANLWGRADGPGVLSAWIGRNADLQDAILAGQSLPLRAEDGFAGVAPVSGLTPDTTYFYWLTLQEGPPDPTAGPYNHFTSFPLPGQPRDFNFVFGSCFRPTSEEGGKIFNAVSRRIAADRLRFGLLLGDQIYADAYRHNGIEQVAVTLDDYRRVYQYTWSRPPLQRLFKSLPMFMTLDDHEVDDDFTWTDASRERAQIPIWTRLERLFHRRAPFEWRIPAERVRSALQAYWEHQGMHAPSFELPPRLNEQERYDLSPEDPGSLAYTFTFGAAAFFVLDTRSMRVRGRFEQKMLGDGQWRVLESWLRAVKDDYPLKFIVSSGSLLFNMWLDIPRDRWSGFPQEQKRLLHFLAAEGIEGVYVLAGDLHSAHAIYATLYGPDGRALPLWEYCSSPFEQTPNHITSRSYTKLRRPPLREETLLFVKQEPNFGIVRVEFSESGKAAVYFDVYGTEGEKIASA